MPFGGHAGSGAAPFLAMGLGIGLRWLYGVVFDHPAANASELMTHGAIIGVALYVVPIIVDFVPRRKRDD